MTLCTLLAENKNKTHFLNDQEWANARHIIIELDNIKYDTLTF